MIGLEFICRNKDIKYKELAEQMGISRQSITNWVTGRNRIPFYHCQSLSEIFNVSSSWFNKELSEADKVILLDLLDDKKEKLIDKINSKRIEVKLFQNQIVDNIYKDMDCWINSNNIDYIEFGKEKLELIEKFFDVMRNSNISIKTLKKTLIALNTDSKKQTEDSFIKSLKLLIEKEEKENKLKNIITKYIELNSKELSLLKELNIDDNLPIELKINKVSKIQRNIKDKKLRYNLQDIKEKLKAIYECSKED